MPHINDITDAWNVDAIGFRNNVYIVHGTDNPAITGHDAPNGTLFLRYGPVPNGGKAYLKIDVQDVDWRELAQYNSSGQFTSIRKIVTDVIHAKSGTTKIPIDTSTPLITEGSNIWSDIITPESIVNKINITFTMMLGSSKDHRDITVAVFRNSVCIAASPVFIHHRKKLYPFCYTIVDTPATTSQITYSVRVGRHPQSSGTWYVNRLQTLFGAYNGLIAKHSYIIEEVIS